MIFKYITGEKVELGDVVIADIFGKEEEGYVEFIVEPKSDEAKLLSCYETGGVMFSIGNERSLVLMHEPDEHFNLLRRKN